MPLIHAADPLPGWPRRVLVAGTSGSGKTTLCRRLAALLGLPHIEIDALFHGPDWTRRPTFEADVRRFSSAPAWVTEWQYSSVRGLLAERADLVVWLDLSRARVMSQVVRRTLSRRLRRVELWNGNIEPPLWTILTDPEHIVRWAWSTHPKTAQRVAAVHRQRPELDVVRLRTRSEVECWLAGTVRDAAVLPSPGRE